VTEFFKDRNNHNLIRYVGFSMAVVGILVAIGAAIFAGVIGSGGLGFGAAGMFVLSFALLPVTDINFSKWN
jgi:hypothetical protein